MPLSSTALAGLVSAVRGRVIAAGDADYDPARRSFNGMIDRRPAVIVRLADATDVSAAVRWATASNLSIAVRGGGHSVAGHSLADDALVVDLSAMRLVSVDPVARTADAQGGCQILDLDRATTAHGLAAPSGTFVDTGIAGLTLVGGLGYLIGTSGFACDALVGAEIVAADGDVREVDADHDPELLWALRGGGGNFGVVTRFRFALTPVGPMYGGVISYPAASTADVLRLLFETRDTAPDELTMQAYIGGKAGGDATCAVVGAWNGEASGGERAFRPLAARSDVVTSSVGPTTYVQLQALNEPMPFGWRHYWKGHFVRDAPAPLIDAIVDAHLRSSGRGGILVEPIHGRAHRIPEESAAFGARAAVANVSALGIWDDPADDDVNGEWARRSAAAFEPFSLRGGGYLNYAPADESVARVEAAYGPERFARLRAVKRRCDPDNRFRFNANIPPA